MLKKRMLLLFMLLVVLQLIPMAVYATDMDKLCQHHLEHAEECGYEVGEGVCTYHCEICPGFDGEAYESGVKEKDTLLTQTLNDSEIVGGSCSTTVKWMFDPATGTLTISGTGKMPGFSYHTQPYASYKNYVKHIIVEEGITTVGAYAFTYCPAETVILPDDLTSIGEFAFARAAFSSIDIPETVTSIENYAFSDCNYLKEIRLPDGLTEIEVCVFNGCSSLTSINVPSKVTSCGSSAFAGCDSLEAVYITDMAAWCRIKFEDSDASPSNPLHYGNNLYLNGELVTDLVVPEGITKLDESFPRCTSLKRVTLPATMTEIGGYAFNECTGIEVILIPDSVTKIGSRAFEGCSSLGTICYTGTAEQWSQINIGGTNYPLLDANVIYNFTGSLDDVAPDEADPYSGSCSTTVKWKFDPATGTLTISGTGKMPGFSYHTQPYASYKNYVKHIIVEDGITTVGDYAFTYSSAKSVTLPDNLTSIGEFAFARAAFTSIDIPETVTSIGNYAFSGCNYLKEIRLPDGLTEIEGNVFNGCSSLTSINVPSKVTSCGYCAFSGCDSLEAVYITDMAAWCRIKFEDSDASPSNPLHYANNLYLNGELVTDLVVPEGITKLDESFPYCTSLKRVTLPATMTEIGGYAFRNCKNLEVILIPDSVTKIGSGAFLSCYNLKTIYYTGTQEEWNAISVAGNNYPLLDATLIFNHTGSIPDHIHRYTFVITAPTCEDRGYTTHICFCGDSYVDSYVDALGHNIVDGKCSRCGIVYLEGLNCVDGVWGYYVDGELATDYTNLVFYNGIFYYVENGLINWDYVGLAQHKETEIWYYVQGGGVDRSFTGLTMYNGRWFYLEAGSITWSYTGLVEFEGNWYFVNYSQLNFDYTDLVLYNGVWYYVQNSVLQWGYYGLVNYNGVWYYLENSHISWTFNDLVLYDDVWYYVKGSTIAWDYTGVVPYGGGMYYVENGTINWGFYGTFEQDGTVYNIENGMVV